MLYWAEGSRNRNRLVFTNSDPEMIRVFVSFLRTAFGVDPDRVRVTCNLFADHAERQHAIEDFWLQTAGLPRGCLCKSTVNHYSRYSQKKRKNKLPNGTCRIVVHSTEIAQTICGSIQELAGFERPGLIYRPSEADPRAARARQPLARAFPTRAPRRSHGRGRAPRSPGSLRAPC